MLDRQKVEKADYIFYSSLGDAFSDYEIEQARDYLKSCGRDPDEMYILGIRTFGQCNGLVYKHRNEPDYYEQRYQLPPLYLARNEELKRRFGTHYLDIIGLIADEKGRIKLFSDSCRMISQDCMHLSRGGGEYLGRLMSPRLREILSER